MIYIYIFHHGGKEKANRFASCNFVFKFVLLFGFAVVYNPHSSMGLSVILICGIS